MEDLVVGISKTAVQLLADKVKSAIKEEAEQWKIVQRDLVFITGEFEMMQSFLDTASEEQVKNRIVRTWVRQVRDLSHDVEDNIDFVLHLDTTKRSWWLRLLPSFGRTAAELPVDEAVAQMTLLRARVVDVSQRNIRYNLIADSASKPMPAVMDDPVQKMAESWFDVLINAVKKTWSELGQFSPLRVYYKEGFQNDRIYSFIQAEPYHSLFSNDLLGRDTEMDELFELTQKSQESWPISVWGMPGVGKSALVEAIYHKLRTSNEFKRRIWVNVSNPFNPTAFCQSFLVNLHRESTSSDGQYTKAFRAQDPIKECRDHLRECVCLFVIDGVQSHEDWDWIKFNLIQYGDSRSCIFIITSEESVAKRCAVSIDRVYNVNGLQATAAMELFGKALGVRQEERLYATEMNRREAAKLLLSKCGGLARVIITVARYLSTTTKPIEEMRRLNDNFMHELATNPEFDSLRDIQTWMHSYLHSCPRHLKKCMLYLSIFPQDIIIRRRRLIRRWVAEGYSKGTDSNSMEKHAEKIFDEVAALSIMQPVLKAGKAVGYQVNGFFREYIMSRSVEDTIFFPVEVSLLEKQGQGRLTTEGIGQHLAIGGSWASERDEFLFESLDISRLRSLTVFNLYFWSFYVSDRMRVLRVLDLENARVQDRQFQEIGKLPSRLKFLSLRGQKYISKLPESVADLLQLQTLDIRDTSILTLPPFITRLRKLQCIRAGKTTVAWRDDDLSSSDEEEESTPPVSRPRNLTSCLPKCLRRGPAAGSRRRSSGGVDLPRGIGRLKALQTLGAVHADSAIGDDVIRHQISRDLPQLKKLHVCGISRKHRPMSLYWLLQGSNFHLESLTLHFVKKNHFVEWDNLFINKNVRSLRMYGHVEQLPRRLTWLVELVKVTLEMTKLFTAEVIEELGKILNLETLRLRVKKDQDGELRFPINLFRRLQVLEIASKSKLHVTFDEGAMEKLEQLKLHCRIESAGTQVFGLEHLVSLKQVWLLGSYTRTLTEELEQQLNMHPKKPALKLE